jgi:hypothetical protein
VNEGAYDSAWADVDRDGDQDLIAPTDSRFAERVFVSNATNNGNHWLYINLAGPSDNTTGIGASLYATLDEGTPQERTLRREANTNAGTFNQSDLPVHFGLGASTEIDTLRIEWPDGTVQHLYDVAVDQYLTIRALPGDYNGNGVVDAADYTVWRDNLGAAAGTLPNDTDSGMIGLAQYDSWKENFGAAAWVGGSRWASSVPVPEPESWLLFLGLAAVGLLARRGDVC